MELPNRQQPPALPQLPQALQVSSNSQRLNSTSTLQAATASAVKAAYDLAAGKAAASHTHPYLNYDIGYNAVGSLCFAQNLSTSTIFPGGTLAGSSLYPVSIGFNSSYPDTYGARGGTALSGTWRCLGYSFRGSYVTSGYVLNGATLWQRIS